MQATKKAELFEKIAKLDATPKYLSNTVKTKRDLTRTSYLRCKTKTCSTRIRAGPRGFARTHRPAHGNAGLRDRTEPDWTRRCLTL
jgi:hypothetical protein